MATGKVLLVSEVLVGGDENIEHALESCEQSAVDSACESLLLDGRYGMTRKDAFRACTELSR